MDYIEKKAKEFARQQQEYEYPFDYDALYKGYCQGAKDVIAEAESMPKIKAWIGRDKDGSVRLFSAKPRKLDVGRTGGDFWGDGHEYFDDIPQDILPEVTWEAEEPQEVELIIRKV